jgi:hypothetical protein
VLKDHFIQGVVSRDEISGDDIGWKGSSGMSLARIRPPSPVEESGRDDCSLPENCEGHPSILAVGGWKTA